MNRRAGRAGQLHRRSRGESVLLDLQIITGILALAGGLLLVIRPDGSLLAAVGLAVVILALLLEDLWGLRRQ